MRAQVQEYAGRHFVYVECWTAREWKRVATFTDDCCPEHALNQAREAGWAWLVDR